MIGNADVGQWVKLSKSQLFRLSGLSGQTAVAPEGTECEVTNKRQATTSNGATLYDVKILGSEIIICCLNYTELTEMTLPEIGKSVFFTF